MRDMAWKDAIVQVLKNTSDPMHYTEIAEAIAEQELRSDFGATPAASVAAAITMSMQKDGTECPFLRISRGYYSLKESEETLTISPAGESEQEEENEETSLINAFGMYWRRDYVYWASVPKMLGNSHCPAKPSISAIKRAFIYYMMEAKWSMWDGQASYLLV